MHIFYIFGILLCTEIIYSIPVEINSENIELTRSIRSPTLHKKKLQGLLFGHGGGGYGGGGYGGGGGGYGGHGGNNYITNINNYGPYQNQNHGHGEVGSFAGSAAVAGGHGGQAQSQSASFAFGPYTGSFSQSQAQSGGRDYFDY